MKQLLILFIGACLCTAALPAQDIESTLGGSTSSQGFTIKDGTGSTLFRLRGDGSLGIGTTSPLAKFNLSDITGSMTGLRVDCNSDINYSGIYVEQSGDGNSAHFRITDPNSTSNCVLANTEAPGAAILANNGDLSGTILELKNGSHSRFQVSSTGVVTMDGSLGIGGSTSLTQAKMNITSSGGIINAIRVTPWSGDGSAIYVNQSGSGNAARFDITNNASTNNCLEASTSATAPAIYASSSNAGGRILQLNNSSTSRFFVETNGNVGIGVDDATQDLDVLYNARFRGVTSGSYSAALNLTSTGILTTSTSDMRLKTNIRPLGASLDKVMQLRGVRYHWKDETEPGERIGFIAQEVREVVPEVVYTNPTDGYLGLNYAELTAVLVEAVKEQQALIEALQAQVKALQAEK